jgi:hypothetical protein
LILITVCAGTGWSLVIAAELRNWDTDILRADMLATASATTVSALGWILWLLFRDVGRVRAEYRRHEAILIQVSGWLAEAKATKPLPRMP